jgi:hypothetical protein
MQRRFLITCVLLAGAVFAYRSDAAPLALDSPVATITSLQQGLIAAATEPRNGAIEQCLPHGVG